MKNSFFALILIAMLPYTAHAQTITQAPDGSYVAGNSYIQTPNGKYVGGNSYTRTPDGK